MAAADSHQINALSADAFSRYIPHQLPNFALENTWVSFQLEHRVHLFAVICSFIDQCVSSSGPTGSLQ